MENSKITVNISAQSVVKVILIGILFYIAFILIDLLLVLLTAVVIASAISPATNWLTRRRIPRVLAVVLLYASLAIFIFAVSYFLLVPLMQETVDFLRNMPEYLSQLEVWNPGDEGFLNERDLLQDIAGGFSIQELINQVNSFMSNMTSSFLGTLSVIFGGILSLILIIVLSFYLSVQENGVINFLKMITPNRHEDYITSLWKKAELKIGYWMQGQIVLALIVGVLTYLGLLLLGVEHALLLGFLAAAFELIPIFGPILAAVPAILIAFVNDGVTSALLVTGLYVIIQQFESQLIYPLVVRKVVGISPIVVILSLIAGFKLAGFLGIILSVPVAAVLNEFLGDFQTFSLKKRKNENKTQSDT